MKFIRNYLERHGDITFRKDMVDGRPITRMSFSEDYYLNHMNFLELFLLDIIDRLTGKYGYRQTIVF